LLGFAGYGISLALFVRALRQLGTARTGAYFSTAPFAGARSVSLSSKRPDLESRRSCGSHGLGVWLHLTERHAHVHAHEPVEHTHEHEHDEHHRHAHAEPVPAGVRHTHRHRHERLTHSHPHYPDSHHRHEH
jgi:hypothetical protein